MKISVIIPAYNEENTILKILEKVNLQKKKFNIEIIVCNDGSTDSSAKILEQNKNLYDHLISNNANFGKGYSIIKSLDYISGDYILIQDADLEYDPDDYEKIFKAAEKGADVVYGSRFKGSDEKRVLYFWHRFANFLITFLVNILTNINFSDVETGFKMIKTDYIKQIQLKEKGFGIEIEITMKLAKIPKIKFFEVGIKYYGRSYEEGKKITIVDGFKAIFLSFYYKLFNK